VAPFRLRFDARVPGARGCTHGRTPRKNAARRQRACSSCRSSRRSFRAGELPFSVLREVTRSRARERGGVARSVEGKTAREVERMVSGLGQGRLAGYAGPSPKLGRHRISSTSMASATRSGARCAPRVTTSVAKRLSDDALVDVIVREPSGDGTSRPCMHAVTTCRVCKQSRLVAGGLETPLGEKACERLLCDSEEVGDLERD